MWRVVSHKKADKVFDKKLKRIYSLTYTNNNRTNRNENDEQPKQIDYGKHSPNG